MQSGERIRDFRLNLRKEKKVAQEEFGKRLGFSQGYIADLERGRQRPSTEFLTRLYGVYGVSSDYILRGVVQEKEFDEETVALGVREKEPEWILSSNRERRLPENTPKRRLIDNVIKILGSGNKKIVKALKSNIDAFLSAIEPKKSEIKEGD